MAISIQLPPELEEKLRASAAKAGMDLSSFINEILENQLKPRASKNLSREERENELLEKINEGISISTWKRYNYLKDLRDREQLDPEEHEELIGISDEIEAANVERMKCLVELAELKMVPVRELMLSLGINPSNDA